MILVVFSLVLNSLFYRYNNTTGTDRERHFFLNTPEER